jgi:hypothetical protein
MLARCLVKSGEDAEQIICMTVSVDLDRDLAEGLLHTRRRKVRLVRAGIPTVL